MFPNKSRIFEAIFCSKDRMTRVGFEEISVQKIQMIGIGLVSVLLPILFGFGRYRYRTGSADTDTDTLGSVNH